MYTWYLHDKKKPGQPLKYLTYVYMVETLILNGSVDKYLNKTTRLPPNRTKKLHCIGISELTTTTKNPKQTTTRNKDYYGIMLNWTKFGLQSHFSAWFSTKLKSFWWQINRRSVITTQIWLDLSRFTIDFSASPIKHKLHLT